MTDELELQTIEKVRRGDADAFGYLVEKHQKLVYNLALKMLGNPEDAEDAAQEAFIKAFRSIDSFRGESKFSVWLYKLTNNVCLDMLRKRREATVSLSVEDKSGGDDAEIEIADDRFSPDEVYEKKEMREALRKGLSELEDDFRSVLVLREVNGLSYDEISEIVSVGDRVEYLSPVSALLGGRYTGAYMDNSAGCTAVIKACEGLLAEGCENKLTAVFTTREETGKGGAIASFTALQPDYAFITDVSFGKAPGVPAEMSSPLGSGGMICISPILQKEVSDFLIKTAENNGIPYTVEVMGSRTMTDSDVAVTAGEGIRTGLVSVPLTNMHTPVETLDIRDVDSVASVLAAAAKEVM